MARKRSSNVRERRNAMVRARPGTSRRQAILGLGSLRLRCALGRSGIASRKREGDGATPLGRWSVRAVYYRSDRGARPATRLPVRPLRECDAWCDNKADRNYNRPVRLPYPGITESLWRDDHLYDIVVELGYNDRPRKRGLGSAIFMHLARPGYTPTEGCIALTRRDLERFLCRCAPGSYVTVNG